MLGIIPDFLDENDPRSAGEQINEKYIGGWYPLRGFTLLENGDLIYPDDPPLPLLWEAKFRNETIRIYQFSWVLIMQPDGSWEVSRLD
jgi:hypothetical protein